MTNKKYSNHIEDEQSTVTTRAFHDVNAQVPQRDVLDAQRPSQSEAVAYSNGIKRQPMNEG